MEHGPPPPLTHTPDALQTEPPGQLPQLTALPQLSVLEPQSLDPQLFETATQPHEPRPPFTPLQVVVAGQMPQLTVPPQPSGALPQLFAPQT